MDSILPQIDPLITGSVLQAPEKGWTIVRVTRLGSGAPATTLFIVPKADR